ncbi:holo-ACP synthase [Camelliibacillus cellulosilyticus]|uniref:Holo-[acyl-carrier-protein] synthase n=1 Tax=Camelliibacillus cellulosilyticus TaxID=2174486 RepID=A0ABV9GLH2_9BACL
MIIGTGVDLIEIARVRKLLGHSKFLARVLTEKEREAFNLLTAEKRRTEFLAGRFAAKEAYSKARRTGIGGQLSFQDIEILNEASGAPVLREKGRAIDNVHLSITHTKDYAAAFVVIESSSG